MTEPRSVRPSAASQPSFGFRLASGAAFGKKRSVNIKSATVAARARRVRAVGLAVVVLLAASVPGCLLPELIVDGSGSGGDSSDLGGSSSGGGSSDGSGAVGSGSASAGGSGGGAGSGGDGSGGTPAGGGTGGDGSGGTSSGGSGSGGNGSGGQATVGGYYESGAWQGYVGTLASLGMIDPPDFDDTLGPPYCVSGEVSADDDFAGVAGWTWNLNQPADCTPAGCVPPLGTFVPTAEGVLITIDNELETELRVQILGPDGATDPDQVWCAPVPGVTGTSFIAWSSFETYCWNGTGTAYIDQEIVTLQIVVPGPGPAGQPATTFDFCVESVVEADDAANGCDLGDPAGSGSYTFDSAFDYLEVSRENENYVVQANFYNNQDGNQAITGTGTAFELIAQSGMSTNTALGFPSVYIGEQADVSSTGSGLPIRVEDITALPTAWSWTQPAAGNYLALYELWFNDPGSSTPSAYIQIILGGEVTPIGTYQGNLEIGPNTWELWTGMLNGQAITTYRYASAVFTQFEYDLTLFVDDAVYGGLSPNLELTMIAAGFQVWSGGVGAASNNFCALVQ